MMPHDRFAEQAVLGWWLHEPELLRSTKVILSDFWTREHRLIAEAIIKLDASGRPVTSQTVAGWLEDAGDLEAAGGASYIDGLPSSRSDREDAETRLIEKSVGRDMLYMSAHIQSRIAGGEDARGLMDETEERLMSIRRRENGNVPTIGEMMGTFRSRLEQGRDDSTSLRFTRHAPLDRIIGAIENNEYGLIVGRPGDGKSTFLKFMAAKQALFPAPESRRGVYLADFEEGPGIFSRNIVSVYTGLDNTLLKHPQDLSEAQLEQIYDATEEIGRSPLFAESVAPYSPAEYRTRVTSAMRICQESFGVPFAFHGSDYIQLMRGEGEGDVVRHTNVSRQIRAMCMANQLNVPYLGTAQLNRGAITTVRDYVASDIKHAGAYEQDATLIIAMSRPWVLHPPGDADVRAFLENVDNDGNILPEWRVEPHQVNVIKRRGGAVGKTRPMLWIKFNGRYVEDERL